MDSLRLRPVDRDDLPTFFAHQADPQSYRMAGVRPRDHDAFYRHWDEIFDDPTAINRSILADAELVGRVCCFERDGRTELGYWISRSHWGRGIATRAVQAFLQEVSIRPLAAIIAEHNQGSATVLLRCGFEQRDSWIGEGTDGEPLTELLFVLERAG